jgi:type IX secretion system substrate protein
VSELAGTFSLTGTSSSGLPVNFSTSNNDRISILGNTATIISPGSITITASQAGNDDFLAAVAVSRTICVLPKKPTIIVAQEVAGSRALTSSATNGNQWYMNGLPIGGATNKTYLAEKSGVFAVRVKVDNCEGAMSEAENLVITGLEEYRLEARLMLFPNPASQQLHIKINGVMDSDETEVRIVDLMGRLITVKKIIGMETTLDISDYPAGSYFIRSSVSKEAVRFWKE